jgi:SAM-dependent methyltransferase
MNVISKIFRPNKAIPAVPAPRPEVENPHPATAARDAQIRGWYDVEAAQLCPDFKIEPADIVADIGCGEGGNALFCAAFAASVILADVDAGALARASATLVAHPAKPVFAAHLTDGDSLPIDNGTASKIICTEVLEHVADPARMMAELVRIGQPGALYLLACPTPVSEAIFKRIAHPSYFEPPNHIRTISEQAFTGYVQDAGLVIEHRHSAGFYHFMWWSFFWACPALGGDFRHPLLDSWARTWALLFEQPQGRLIKNVLDDMLPKSQIIIARKPW